MILLILFSESGEGSRFSGISSIAESQCRRAWLFMERSNEARERNSPPFSISARYAEERY